MKLAPVCSTIRPRTDYDSLNRVIKGVSTATSGTDCWGQAVPPWSGDLNTNGYDRFGNLFKIDSVQCSNPTLNLPVNTNNQFTTFSYDAPGNVLGDGFYTYTWNAEGHPTTAASVTYT